MLKEVEMTDFHFNVHMDGKITFEVHSEEGTLPEVFPEAHTRVSRAAKAATKAATQESVELSNNLLSNETPKEKSIKKVCIS